MSVILEFTVESKEFTLGRVLSGPPDGHVELERIVPTSTKMMPFVWVTGVDFEAFEQKVFDHQAVEDFVALDRIDDSTLYRITWRGEHNDIVRGIVEADGTVLEAHGDGDWKYRIRFRSHDDLSAFYNYCTDHEISIHVDRAFTMTERSNGKFQFDLTQEQREALLVGLRRGYFETPSSVTSEALAEELDITQQAVSERIRRGTEKILEATLQSTASDFD